MEIIIISILLAALAIITADILLWKYRYRRFKTSSPAARNLNIAATNIEVAIFNLCIVAVMLLIRLIFAFI